MRLETNGQTDRTEFITFLINTFSENKKKSSTVSTHIPIPIKRYEGSVDNTDKEHSSVFTLMRMRWLPSARACGQ